MMMRSLKHKNITLYVVHVDGALAETTEVTIKSILGPFIEEALGRCVSTFSVDLDRFGLNGLFELSFYRMKGREPVAFVVTIVSKTYPVSQYCA